MTHLAVIAALALAGCTTATITMPDGTHVQFTRFATDAAIELTQEGFVYSSSPSEIAQRNAIDALVRALGLAVAAPDLRRGGV